MTRFERWAIWTTTVLTAVSGFGYAWTKYLLDTADPWAVVNHPLEPWFLRVHVVAAPLFVFAFGLIAVRHVWKHIATGVRRARRSGLSVAALLVPMVLTGYLVQVVTHAGWLRAIALSHIGIGTLYVVGIAVHQIALGRRTAKPDQPGPRRVGWEESGPDRALAGVGPSNHERR